MKVEANNTKNVSFSLSKAQTFRVAIRYSINKLTIPNPSKIFGSFLLSFPTTFRTLGYVKLGILPLSFTAQIWLFTRKKEKP